MAERRCRYPLLRGRWILLVVLVAFGANPGTLFGQRAWAERGPALPVPAPPPREASPFTSRDSLCTARENSFEGVSPEDLRVTGSPITVVLLTPGPDSSTTVPPAGPSGEDPADIARAFGEVIKRCGGIGGRRLDFRVLVQTADPVADCLEATRTLHAFIVVSWTASPAQSCVARDEKTIMVTVSDVSNEELSNTQGRLVATGSTEGTLQALVVALIESGRLAQKRVAVVVGTSPADVAFERTANELLLASGITLVGHRADVILTTELNPATLPSLTQAAATGSNDAKLEVYGFGSTPDGVIDQLRVANGAPGAKLVDTIGVFTLTSLQDPQPLVDSPRAQFAAMCNDTYASVRAKGAPASGRHQLIPVVYNRVTKICLAMRIVARGLYNAGVHPTQQSVVRALYRLPYIENEFADPSPAPRPNQVVNEPVTRASQVVVLNQAEYPCTHPSSAGGRSVERVCFAPAPGWDAGGHAINVLLTNPNRVARQ